MENRKDGEASIRYRRGALRLFAVELILFLVLSTRFFPTETWTEFAFTALMVLLFGIFLLMARIVARAKTKRPIRTAVLLAAAVNVIALSLFVTHALKLDAARADYPKEGAARLLFTYESSVYSPLEGFVEDMDVTLSVGDVCVESGNRATVYLSERTEIRCATTFALSGQAFAGDKAASVRISPRRLRKGYKTSVTIPCGDDTECVVEIMATYEPTFWEVLLH